MIKPATAVVSWCSQGQDLGKRLTSPKSSAILDWDVFPYKPTSELGVPPWMESSGEFQILKDAPQMWGSRGSLGTAEAVGLGRWASGWKSHVATSRGSALCLCVPWYQLNHELAAISWVIINLIVGYDYNMLWPVFTFVCMCIHMYVYIYIYIVYDL